MNGYEFKLEKVRDAIDGVNIVSFDVFDTLIIRDFHYPVDIFKYIEDKFKIPRFQEIRIITEVKIRSDNLYLEDIKYSEIYREITQIGLNLELDVELQACIENSNIRQLYDYALSQNKRIIAISDMYLDKKFIQELLFRNGFDSIEKIYVSGNLNKTKGSGQLYEYVFNDLGADASNIVHIGDNYNSDYTKAKEKGIKSFYYKALRECYAHKYNEYLLEKIKNYGSPQSSLYAGILINNYYNNYEKGYWYNFGFEYSGILIFNFMHYIYDYCKANEISRVYFMARDGKIMKDVFDVLYSFDTSIKTHYMLASRRLFFVPSIKCLDEKTLEYLVSSLHGVPYIDVINKFGFDWLVYEAEEYFKDICKPILSGLDREELKVFLLLHKRRILDEVFEERKNLLAYLKDIDFIQDNNRLLVDVGWGCSSQKFLESIIQEKTHAIYYGTHKEAYYHDLLHGYIFDKGLPEKESSLVLSALPIVELLFVGDHYSVVKIDQNVKPVYHKKSLEEDQRIEIASCIHQGVLDFVNKYQKVLEKYDLPTDQLINTIVLNSLIIKPSMQDILHISKVPHAAALGESSYEDIIKNLDQTHIDFIKNILSGKVLENNSLWPSGKLRYNNLLHKDRYKVIVFMYNIADSISLFLVKVQRCRSYSFKICVKKIFKKIYRLNFKLGN